MTPVQRRQISLRKYLGARKRKANSFPLKKQQHFLSILEQCLQHTLLINSLDWMFLRNTNFCGEQLW